MLAESLLEKCSDRIKPSATPEGCVHELFERQAALTPDAVAVRFEEQSLSYAELNRRANRLARHVRLHYGAEAAVVGICLERGMDAIVAVIGVLKAGAAYAAVDLAYPAQRQAYILRDSNVSVVISSTEIIRSLPADCAFIDMDRCDFSRGDAAENPAASCGPQDLAYLIYTSGSTGTPKGVRMPHRALVNLLAWQMRDQGDYAGRRTLQFSPLSFDVSFQEIFSTLASGGELVLIPNRLRLDPLALLSFIEERKVERIFLPYVALNSLATAAVEQDRYPRSLLDVVTAGEQLVVTAAIRRFFNVLPQCRLHNHYGPSESHVVTAYTLPGRADEWPTLPPVGVPIDNVEIHLLDEENRARSDGEPGELCIAGVQLAYGYHRRPEESAAGFVDIDVDGTGIRRLYRTGDLARRRPDGLLEVLGRMDFQVKIRGHRVELGEVEALLMRHPAVRDAVVVAQGDGTEDKFLAAFVIVSEQAQQRQTPDGVQESIHCFMREAAPEYLRPAAVAIVSRFPLSASGKIDRKAFPVAARQALTGRDFTPARTPLEQVLAEAWSELLGIREIGRNAHFFKLGGHSLLVVKMMLALRRRGFMVDAHTLYQHPVLSELATQLRAFDPLAGGPATARLDAGEEAPCWAGLGKAEQDVAAAAVLGGLANIQDVCPLGPLQQGMFYHALANPAGDPHVLWQVVRFDSEDLLRAYLDALRRTIARHDAFRVAVLHEGLPQPLQVVWREAELPVEELRGDGEDALAALRRRCEPAMQCFDISRAPLQRAFYCRDAQRGQWVLLHQLHHLAVDHATVEKMQWEIEAQLLGKPLAPVSAMPFSQARAGLYGVAGAAEHKAFFDAMLNGYEPGPAPFGAQAHLAGDAIVEEAWRPLRKPLRGQIRQQAKAHGVSVAAIFHLAWAKVVASLSGRDDVVFGTVLLGRMFAGGDADSAMGQFINTLPLRLRLDNLPVLECLWGVQDALTHLLKHEQAPLALAQKSARMPGNAPLFTTLLNYRHSEVRNVPSADPFRAVNPSAVDGVAYSGIMERTTYPVSVNVDDFADDFVINAQVERGLDPERVCDCFETALREIAAALENAPEKRIGRISVLPEQEKDLLRQWNRTEADFPAQACLHALIEAQARRTPDAVAVEFAGSVLSYAQLNRRANQLARHLREDLGVVPDALVGVCVQRSLEMVVALLAVLKAGGAYVPLDPHYPGERLAYMLDDAAPGAVLCHGGIPDEARARLADYAAGTGAALIDLIEDAAGWSGRDDADLSPEDVGLSPANLAYVIYTSGSTGRPKGVMNEHRGVVNRLAWMQKAYRLNGGDVVLQKTPFSFDVSVWEFFWPLMQGSRLLVAKPEGHKDPAYLSELIQARGVTTLHFVPSMLSAFLEQAEPAACGSLRRVFCSGEALPAHSVRRFRERFADVELHNLYGPTEAAIDVTAWDCRQYAAGDAIPIGRPIDNIRIHILDAHGEPCPVGVAGELHIAGVGVARGYLNQAELTAEKFVRDAFHPGPGRFMYRTGDLARHLPGGDIEYLGRNDFQVKLRGFRIELGEVESALLSHSSVKECVALVREDVPGDARLVAYATRAPGCADDAPEALNQALRRHLQTRLPAFMTPSNILWLDAFPLTGNGKLDRKALPSPVGAPPAQAAAQPPREGTEARLAQLWGELLNAGAIGRQTHFFEAGGHSLLAVALMARIRQAFNLSLSLSAIVAHLDLASQAELIDAELARDGAARTQPAPAEAAVAGARIRALPAQKAIYKAVKLNPMDVSNNSFVALAFDAEPDLKHLRGLLQTVFSRHEGLGAKFVLEDGELFLLPGARFLFRLEKRQSLGSLEEDLRDFIRPFSLEDGMNVRGRWLADARQPVLLLDFSHACIDGSGLMRILEELAADGGQAPAGASLAGYSELFHSAGFAALRQAHADFWSEQLRGWSPVPPADQVQPQNRCCQLTLDAARKARIDALAARLKISVPEFFMAVFLGFKARLDKQRDQLVSMIFHGRDRLEQQAVIAPLMTVLPVRFALPDLAAGDETLRGVSAAVRAACRHYLFDAEALAVRQPELSRQALFPAAFFGYFKKEGYAGRIAGMPCRQLDMPNIAGGQAHWSLSCEIAEHDAGFDVRLEGLSQRTEDAVEDWEALFNSIVQSALDDGRQEN
ncbi:non-ribosomal peptide synthetase [Chromobacterium sphagni]|uniref:Non-ribosomal peptide synthetase n=1 Tax=Chromobacterium sphagni TaxID=1903179 RepID=A0A1S1WWC8_9NEIS|nr:non-ribosomal peptide synthetase [Chromobacterium sphagni]OHX11610.1 non-ribosomal peptide synthetase [Chromobacterium sphagni]